MSRHYTTGMRWFWPLRIALLVVVGQTSTSRAQVADTTSATANVEEASTSHDTRTVVGVQDLPETGFQWGLGVGIGLPLGNADGGATLFADVNDGSEAFVTRDGSMSGIASFQVPLALDLGYRVSPTWWLGLRPHVGTGGKGDECPTTASCHFTGVGLSALLKYHHNPKGSMDPWLGVGLGWEWLLTTLSVAIPQSVRAKQALSGPLLQALGGLAFDLGAHIHAGPYATASIGRYVWNSLDCSEQLGCPSSYFVKNGAFHAWLGIGVGGEYGP